jgi:hypothetical protein
MERTGIEPVTSDLQIPGFEARLGQIRLVNVKLRWLCEVEIGYSGTRFGTRFRGAFCTPPSSSDENVVVSAPVDVTPYRRRQTTAFDFGVNEASELLKPTGGESVRHCGDTLRPHLRGKEER